MALNPVKLAYLQESQPITQDKEGRPASWFIRALNGVFKTLSDAINGIIAAQNAAEAAQATADTADGKADNAQTTADGAQATAATAQARADDAYDLAVTAVQKDVGPTWTSASGTADRSGFSEYVEPTASVLYDPAQMQDVMHAAHEASQALVAIINDLRANHALTP